MGQSSTIAAALIIGFIVFITVKGQLSQYLGVLGIGANAVNAPSTTTSNSSVTNPGTVSIGNFGLGSGVLGATSGLGTSVAPGVSEVNPLAPIPGLTQTTPVTLPGTAPVAPVVPSLTLNDGTNASTFI